MDLLDSFRYNATEVIGHDRLEPDPGFEKSHR